MSVRASRRGFQKWLESKHPRSVVGHAHGKYEPDEYGERPLCPLGRYQAGTGARFGPMSWPAWATGDEASSGFMDLVDQAYPSAVGRTRPVTAAAALRILKEMP